nr:DUF2634 domain-containing protein [Desulforamulus aquiferis]
MAVVDDLESYIQWCRKALLTPRYRHLIYSRNYGSEFEELIGRGLTRAAIESEIKRITTETLMVDPRTASVHSFFFEHREDAVYFSCSVSTVRGDIFTIDSLAKGVV